MTERMPTESGGITGTSPHASTPAADIVLAEESPAERRAIVRGLAHALDVHDAEHVGAWSVPDEEGCPFC